MLGRRRRAAHAGHYLARPAPVVGCHQQRVVAVPVPVRTVAHTAESLAEGRQGATKRRVTVERNGIPRPDRASPGDRAQPRRRRDGDGAVLAAERHDDERTRSLVAVHICPGRSERGSGAGLRQRGRGRPPRRPSFSPCGPASPYPPLLSENTGCREGTTRSELGPRPG